MSFGAPYPGSFGVPATVERYLLPQETQVVTVRYHPASLIPTVLAVLAALTAASTITTLTGAGGTLLVAVWAVAVLTCLWLAVRAWAWLDAYLVMTRDRVMIIPGITKHRLVIIPAREITDINLHRSLPGRLLGYGQIELTPAREDHEVRTIRYVPYPWQVFREARGVYLGEDQASDTPVAFPRIKPRPSPPRTWGIPWRFRASGRGQRRS